MVADEGFSWSKLSESRGAGHIRARQRLCVPRGYNLQVALDVTTAGQLPYLQDCCCVHLAFALVFVAGRTMDNLAAWSEDDLKALMTPEACDELIRRINELRDQVTEQCLEVLR